MIFALFLAVVAVLVALWAYAAVGTGTLIWAAVMITILLRLVVAVRENNELMEQVRTDQLTGLGNQGGMQIDLQAHCARAGAERPLAVVLFDLDGFKRFNDTFGHPAGDELLADFGSRIRSVVSEDGGAYRVGGDEFCLILTCEESRVADVVRGAAMALSTRWAGVDVTTSWGMAAVPDEATTPREALQLADLRMYAQKESRRVSREAYPASPLEAGTLEA